VKLNRVIGNSCSQPVAARTPQPTFLRVARHPPTDFPHASRTDKFHVVDLPEMLASEFEQATEAGHLGGLIECLAVVSRNMTS
jgi:hypothetical protein